MNSFIGRNQIPAMPKDPQAARIELLNRLRILRWAKEDNGGRLKEGHSQSCQIVDDDGWHADPVRAPSPRLDQSNRGHLYRRSEVSAEDRLRGGAHPCGAGKRTRT
jgi:hypothetical protein